MKRTWWMRCLLIGSVLVLSLALSGDTSAGWDVCRTYYDSTPTVVPDYGFACAGRGPGCRECSSRNGVSCVENIEANACIDYQDPVWDNDI